MKTDWKIYSHTTEATEGALALIEALQPTTIHILTDETVKRLIVDSIAIRPLVETTASITTISPGDENKNIDSVMKVWQDLSAHGAKRNSLLINVGGGMVTDLGGFAAATFKRGIIFINISTTLLGAVDASIGGKTGINFNGLKNEVGAFAEPICTLIPTDTFATLSTQQLLSGYGEVLKTAMLENVEFAQSAFTGLEDLMTNGTLNPTIPDRCLRYKARIVEEDPFEHGIRKFLNFGHTVGHAFESLSMRKGKRVEHGIAVAHGLLAELILSNLVAGMNSALIEDYAALVRQFYGKLPIDCGRYDELIDLMRHDKKNNDAQQINFTLLNAPGHPVNGLEVSTGNIEAALDIYRDLVNA